MGEPKKDDVNGAGAEPRPKEKFNRSLTIPVRVPSMI